MLQRMFLRLAVVMLMSFASWTATAAVNYQDMWWNANESGWGVNVAQQNNTMFATWFIYGTSNQPTWVVMSNAQRSGAGGNVFRGDIYTTTGPYFGLGVFNTASVTVSNPPVGVATFTFSDARTGTLSYTVNGATVIKQITRQPLESINLTGTYYGGIFRTAACANSGVSNSIFSIAHTPATSAITITEVGGNLCRFTGALTQFGSIFEGNGTYTCQGESGTWTGAEGTGGETAFSMKLSLQSGAGTCVSTFGGFKSP